MELETRLLGSVEPMTKKTTIKGEAARMKLKPILRVRARHIMSRGAGRKRGHHGPMEMPLIAIEGFAALGCTDAEIAYGIGVSPRTFSSRKADTPTVIDAIEKGKEKGKETLRRLQWRSARRGSVPMQIFMGKNLLNQSDKQSTEVTGKDGAPFVIEIVKF